MIQSKVVITVFLALWAAITLSKSAVAQPVTVQTQTVVVFSDLSDFTLGELVDLSYTFETSTIDASPEPDIGTYPRGVVNLSAAFGTSGKQFSFASDPFAVFNSASVSNDQESAGESVDILSLLRSNPTQADTVGEATVSVMQIAFTDLRLGGSPAMVSDDRVPVTAFPFSFAIVSLLDSGFNTIGSVVTAPIPSLPNPDDLPIFEVSVPNPDGEFEILDAQMSVVGSLSGALAKAVGVASEIGGNKFFTFKSNAGTPAASDFFMRGRLRIANDLMGPADLREMKVRASLRMNGIAPGPGALTARLGADPTMVQFVLTDEMGNQMATPEQAITSSEFQSSEFATTEFTQPVGGALSIDLTRIVELSFGFSAPPTAIPEMEINADNISVPEPNRVPLQLAALVLLAALRFRQHTRIGGPTGDRAR